MAMGMYTRERVLAKTFAWRIIATLTGAAVAGLLTGEIETAGWFIVIEFPLKMGFYYFHERAWEAVEWGVAEETPQCEFNPISLDGFRNCLFRGTSISKLG
tara:strand:- start:121 stop:423 length:303 start_codon:yes stop_codon:yes gene_type:complete